MYLYKILNSKLIKLPFEKSFYKTILLEVSYKKRLPELTTFLIKY